MTSTGAAGQLEQLTVQLLDWIALRPRTYEDVMDAWRTSCPRLSVWEDALIGGLVECTAGSPQAVRLTPRGRAVLERHQSLRRLR